MNEKREEGEGKKSFDESGDSSLTLGVFPRIEGEKIKGERGELDSGCEARSY